jgi:hypothetical protein
MKQLFPARNDILDNVGLSLASAQQAADTSTYSLVLMYLRTNTRIQLHLSPSPYLTESKTVARNCCFRDSRDFETLTPKTFGHASNYPAFRMLLTITV